MKTTFKNTIKKTALSLTLSLGCFLVGTQTGGADFQTGPTMMRGKIFPTATCLDNGKVITFSGRETNFISYAFLIYVIG
jgi:hypothetical protein